MNGKDLVINSIELTRKTLEEIKAAGILAGDQALDDLAKACDTLDLLKSKATLRTKNGTSMAFPIKEAAEYLEEVWEDTPDDADDVKDKIESFVSATQTLASGLKERTVIMT